MYSATLSGLSVVVSLAVLPGPVGDASGKKLYLLGLCVRMVMAQCMQWTSVKWPLTQLEVFMGDVLIVDDDLKRAQMVARVLETIGAGWRIASSLAECHGKVAHQVPDLVLTSEKLPDGRGANLLPVSGGLYDVVVVGDQITPEGMLECISRGARDFLVRPINEHHIAPLVAYAGRTGRISSRCHPLDEVVKSGSGMVVGSCVGMLDALKTAGLAARTSAAVMIYGESGTGKDLMAREIHTASGRSGRFVALNCAAVAEGIAESELFGHERGAFTGAVTRRAGCFEQADGGTLFLDEIGEASPAFQAKLLRALDRGEFSRVGGQSVVRTDVRLVAATNRDLEAMVEAGPFRLDLFYRLSAMTISLPPLRERREDIPYIVQAMLLQHVIHRAVLACQNGVIHPEHFGGLKSRKSASKTQLETLCEIEQAHIERVLVATGGNQGRACELLGVSRPTLRRKIRRYALVKNMEHEFDLDLQEGSTDNYNE